MSKYLLSIRVIEQVLISFFVMMLICFVFANAISLAATSGNGIEILPTPEGLVIEKDVMVSMPDGVKIACNIVRPGIPGKFPVILSMSPYDKDNPPTEYFGSSTHMVGNDHISVSMLTPFEGPDPAFWVPNGYAAVHFDSRGSGKSGGECTMFCPEEMDDYVHLIAWAATREWSNGNVGLMGVSYLAMNQWHVAAKQPPYLKAIIPWQGISDMYRDHQYLGGIPQTIFGAGGALQGRLKNMPPAKAAEVMVQFFDPVANQKILDQWPKLENITVPALICATWSDKGLHTRGSFEGFRRISSEEKWLYTHGGKKWERFYSKDALDYQKRFFDHYLKGVDNGWESAPRVRLEVRVTRDEYAARNEKEFPLERTEYKKLYLDPQEGSLSLVRSPQERQASYNSVQGGSISFGITFDDDTELSGYMKARLWVAAKDGEDMDLFLAVKKYDTMGNEVQFRGMNGWPYCVAARGQMRVSQRALDETLSTDWQPVQKFEGEKKLTPGEIVPVDIALLPSSTLFRKGESMRLFIQGHEPVVHPLLGNRYLINRGVHIVYSGGKYDSYLQIPVIEKVKN